MTVPQNDSSVVVTGCSWLKIAYCQLAIALAVKVVQFSKLMELLPEGTDQQAALRLLQQVAVMVQGCWVVKR